MPTLNLKTRRTRRISLTVRGSLLILLAAVSVGLPVAIVHVVVTRARQNEYLATSEAFLATALSAHLDNMTHTSQQYADWVMRLESQSDQLRWAGVLEPDGEGVEFRRRTAFPVDRILKQLKFDLDAPRIHPLLVGGLPSNRLRLICVPQPESGAVLAAIVDTGPGSSLPGSMFAWTVGLICTGLAVSFAWLHYGLILPLRRSAAALANIQTGAAELSLDQLPAEEFNELASSIHETKRQLYEWKERAENLSESVDRRVESITRASTRARKRAEREAGTDVLSGLASRRTLERELPALVKSHRLSGRELAVAMIDVNDFKAYNDLKGHVAGDELIAFIGGLIRSSTRRNVDLNARYGGDEFVIVMPDTSLSDAVKIMRRMAAMFTQFVKTQPDLVTPPSLAAGIACLHEDGVRTAEQLIELADTAMYRAKRGRLPVVTAGGA